MFEKRLDFLKLLAGPSGILYHSKNKTKQCKRFSDIDKIKGFKFKNKAELTKFKQDLKTKNIVKSVIIKKKRKCRYLVLNPKYTKQTSDIQKKAFQNNDRMIENLKRLKWGFKIKEKYGFRCIICGSSKKLNAHHLNGWNKYIKERFSIKNGVVLCKKCHNKFHKIYGNKNNCKEQFLEFKKNETKKKKEI